MGLFNKKKGEQGVPKLPSLPEFPSLPELPTLPESPNLDDFSETPSQNQIHQLPRFPNGSLSSKFSQNTIKDAITGQKEGEEEEVEGFEMPIEAPMIQPPLKRIPLTRPIEMAPEPQKKIIKEAEPIFIRIDKFEEALKIFNETKNQISRMERLLEQTKEIKEKEEFELQEWTKEIQKIKNQIEKVDRDIFSKI